MKSFKPFPDLNLKNRFVMAPMTRYSCKADGSPTEELANYYMKRAENNVGLIIIESSAINDNNAMGYINGSQFHTKAHALNWKPVIDKIHLQGAKVWIQLFHAGRLTVREVTNNNVVAPSAIKTFNTESFWRPKLNGEHRISKQKTKYTIPTELSVKEIKQIIKQFSDSAGLLEQAGFDGVELHGAWLSFTSVLSW